VRMEHAADHSPPSSAAVMEECSYTSTHSLGHTGPVTGSLPFTSQVYTVLGLRHPLKKLHYLHKVVTLMNETVYFAMWRESRKVNKIIIRSLPQNTTQFYIQLQDVLDLTCDS